MAAMVAEELYQSNDNSDIKKEGTQHIEARTGESIKKKWESKVMYGQYVRSMDRQLITTDNIFLHLSKGNLKGETEAAQDQALQTKISCNKNICKKFDEIVECIISASQIQADPRIHGISICRLPRHPPRKLGKSEK
jgi:hypothetical protein